MMAARYFVLIQAINAQEGVSNYLSKDIFYLGDEAMSTVQIEDQETQALLKTGYNHLEIILPKVEIP
jgi:hypothetical protein